MANRFYPRFRQAMASRTAAGLAAPVDLAVDTVRLACVSPAYAPNDAADQFFSAVAPYVLDTPQALAYASSTGGVFKSSNNPSYTIPATAVVARLVIYKDTGVAATSPLIAVIDSAPNLPFTAASAPTVMDVTMDPTNGWFST
jgi:hypothetical protein